MKYEESDFSVDQWGDTAVASYRFAIGYEMNGRLYEETGRDLFVLNYRKGKWLAVWRTLVPADRNS